MKATTKKAAKPMYLSTFIAWSARRLVGPHRDHSVEALLVVEAGLDLDSAHLHQRVAFFDAAQARLRAARAPDAQAGIPYNSNLSAKLSAPTPLPSAKVMPKI